MKFRASLAFIVVASSAACTSAGDTLLAPVTGSASFDAVTGVKPPPPLGSEETDIFISVSPSECGLTCGAARLTTATSFAGTVSGRYFANTQQNSGWVEFESNAYIIASSNARIQFDRMTGQKSGQGTLTLRSSPFTVLDLKLVHDVRGTYGPCDVYGSCAQLQFLYGDDGVGFLTVNRAGTGGG